MLSLRDAREARDVLALVVRSLARDFERPCVAYGVRDRNVTPIVASDPARRPPPLARCDFEFEPLRAETVVRHGAAYHVGIVAEGTLRAVIVIEPGGGPLDAKDLKAVRALAMQASLAFANALAFEQLRRYAAEGAALTDAARTILGFTEIGPLAAALSRLAIRLTLAERAGIYAVDGDALERLAYTSLRDDLPLPAERVPLAAGDAAAALTASFAPQPAIVARLPLPGGASVEPRGLLVVSRDEPFERGEWRIIETLVSLGALAIRNVDLYEQTARANRALAESNAFKDDLMAMFAHDFKGPLTVISGFSELLADSEHENVREGARTIGEQARRLAKLSEDALALSASQSAGFSLRREHEDLAEFVRATAGALDREGARIVVAAPEAAIPVAFDRLRLRHAIDNVLANALKYSSGPVSVTVVPGEREVEIRVSDRGIGIPAADLERIFTRFGRATNARSQGVTGSGVGLYIAKKIVEVHGGRLEVRSVEAEGSTFTIVLPLA